MGDVLKFVVRSGAHAAANCPVSISLPWSYADCKDVALVEETTMRPVAAQVAKAGKGAHGHVCHTFHEARYVANPYRNTP